MSMSTPEKPRTILIVDDEPSVVAYLQMLLGDQGYMTITAADGTEAMDKAKSQRPDLITLDISMPQTTGIRFYKEILADPELASIPIVIVTAVTGYAGDPYGYHRFMCDKLKLTPPAGFFPKPIDKDRFLEAVRQLLPAG